MTDEQTGAPQWRWASVTLRLPYFLSIRDYRDPQRIRDSGARWLLRRVARAAGDHGAVHTPVVHTSWHPLDDPTRVHVTFYTQWHPEPLFDRGRLGVLMTNR